MADVIVTLPQSFGLQAWIAEGPDLPSAPWSGEEWHFYLGGAAPVIQPGDRVYVCYRGLLRGYAPLVRIERYSIRSYALVRHNGAVAVTIPDRIPGFRGFRYVWWSRDQEIPFPNWHEEEPLYPVAILAKHAEPEAQPGPPRKGGKAMP